MSKNILITGGTGLLGKILTKELQNQGHQVSILSRNPDKVKNVKAFYWDVEKQEIDESCLQGIDTIVHLAGEGIADKKWTPKRKKEIIDSRVDSIQLLYSLIAKNDTTVKSIVSASAVGFYGNRADEILTEESPKGTGFLSDSCGFWEEAVDKGNELGLRVIKLRIGLLLTPKGGVLEPFKLMVKTFSAMKFGSGKQWFPWVHATDLVGMFAWAVNNSQFEGVYNATAPSPVTNTEFTKTLAKVMNRPFWPFQIPVFLLKIALGERKELLLMSNRTDSQKIQDAGYRFKYTDLKKALEDVTSRG
jgi:uncharacterized protein (TIGR01777 family)